jgi:hypothetical protein
MTNYPVRIRIGNTHAGDYETNTYTNSTFADAVAALQGSHSHDGDYHRSVSVYVVATYEQDHTEHHGPKRQIERKADEPVFGYEATIYGREIAFGGQRDSRPSWASKGAGDTDEAELMLSLYQLAVQIAKAANAEPFCADCQPALDRYAARQARLG